jgi:hypothetical protein
MTQQLFYFLYENSWFVVVVVVVGKTVGVW